MGAEEHNRRDDDMSISTLTMAVERLAESQANMSVAQTQMAVEIKDLAKTISKLDIVMEKMLNMEERHNIAFNAVDSRIKLLEKGQLEGCPALREVKVEYNGRYDKVLTVLNANRESIEKMQGVVNRVAWGIVSVVGMAILGLVINK